MEAILQPIALKERSYNVTLLHKALSILGMPIIEDEVAQCDAGEDTLRQVRTLQEKLGLPIDKSTLLNEATIDAIGETLEKRGLLATSRLFTVTGTVRMQDGLVKKRQRLLAFDLDLRGVVAHRIVKNGAEVQENSGFEFLGQTYTDSRGNYNLTFYDWQYRRAERKKADVVVYAIEGDEEGGRIVGRSRLVDSDDYSEKGLVRGLDIIVAQIDSRTEYEQLISCLDTFLKENRTTLAEICTSSEQLAFTAAELDIEPARLKIAAAAEWLMRGSRKRLSHELLYGIGRQDIRLTWPVLYRKTEDELRSAIAKSIETRIVHDFKDREITQFLKALRERSVREMLSGREEDGGNTLDAMLSNALPKKAQRLSFLNAVTTFKGNDFRDFWNDHLPAQPGFKDKPQLISSLLLTQQLALLTGNHQTLVNELQVNMGLTSIDKLFDLEEDDWIEIVRKTGIPDFVQGENDEEKTHAYVEAMQGMLNAAFPTRRIANMVQKDELPIENTISRSIIAFLKENAHFDFAASHIHEFKDAIKTIAGENSDEMRNELKKIQRVFQVSTSPQAMRALMENNLHSAYTVANIPRKSFIKTYGGVLGGELVALAIHERASHISTRTEMAAMHIMEYSHSATPKYALGEAEYDAALATIKKHLPNPTPNYAQLFGSPDICECEHCRSVYGASAYMVELLRFLWRSQPNSEGKTPLHILEQRRPDLLHLPLTCENANTIIPYIDLANEVMEYYTANDSLKTFKGYNTGEATTEELRASPQNFNLQAYSKLKDAKYPFILPYHQPLDAIRVYSDHLKVSRYDVMKAINPQPDPATANAIAAEALHISEEEYKVLTGKAFNGASDSATLHEYFGYDAAEDLKKMSAVREFMHRSGIAYKDLVELVKTHFINPYQSTLDFLDRLFSYSSISANTIYARLVQIETGTLDPANDSDIMGALTAYNKAQGKSITANDLAQWVTNHLSEFRQVITLYEPESRCDLDNTQLCTVQSIHTDSTTSSGISNATWSKAHHFIRLWRKLGWTIHETDIILAALGEDDIATSTINKLECVSLLKEATNLAPNQLSVAWGNIDTCGKSSLYRKLFLNKAVQKIDAAFEADAWGNYLQNDMGVLADHQSALLAAFQMREDDLVTILGVARVIDGGASRPIDINNDKLNLGNLSTIYRYVMLSKALKMRIADLCKVIDLFDISPFSTWDIQQKSFTNISPGNTFKFYKIVESIKKAGFKAEILDYVFNGRLPADSKAGLDKTKILDAAKTIRETFMAIEQNHPETPPSPLTTEILTAKLALTYQPEIVTRFIGILERTTSFQTVTDKNLDITIPDALSRKYTYVKGSGRLICNGVMSDAERLTLTNLSNIANFKTAVDVLYTAPESFISNSFSGILVNLAEAKATLLDHPAQAKAATLDEKLVYVYKRFIPILKQKLRRDAVAQHVAALIGLSEAATTILIAQDVDALITDLAKEGFSATYFSDATWTTSVLSRTDKTVDFSWGADAPDLSVPANNFSVRWEAYIVAPASGEYTLRADVEEADEVFKLYLDDVLIPEKTSADAATIDLNATKMHSLRLEYAELSQNASVRLQWMTATTAPEVVPASVSYPAAILDAFAAQAAVYHRAAKLISGFELSETELNHLITFAADFGNIDFKALKAEHWHRVSDYTSLRNAVPQAQSMLTDIFAAANTTKPIPTVDDLRKLIYQATAWDEASLEFLVAHFGLSVPEFRNEIALNRLREVMQIFAKTGLSAQTIAMWGKAETDFTKLNNTAQLIKNAVKARYQEKDWLDLASNLSDILRKNQQHALVGYLLTRPEINTWGAKDADGLFEYFLIDVQMGTCMDSSRIVQANAVIQMFINRCLLNLESDTSNGSEKGISPDMIDKDRWEWMENYRVWEANRKVFLYPENWLEPEWRNDRSEFFKELESYLVQNDITDRSVEQAFRNYLNSLNEVANLDVCGMYQENYDDGSLKFLHVFACTRNAPYKFFYRRWNEYRRWSAWEQVPVDIRFVEDGENSGVHLIPVVWKKRLFLFWPEFMKAQDERSENGKKSIVKVGTEQNIESLKPTEYWQIRLAWSEYVDGKWSPKKLAKEYLRAGGDYKCISQYTFHTSIVAALSVSLHNMYDSPYDSRLKGKILIPDIQSAIQVDDRYGAPKKAPPSGVQEYTNHFLKHRGQTVLNLGGNLYLKKSVFHMLLHSNDKKYVRSSRGKTLLKNPFFFIDWNRTYFVRPVDVTIIEGLKNPGSWKLDLPGPQIDNKDLYPFDIMPEEYSLPGGGLSTGPEDYLPLEATMAEFAGEVPVYDYRVHGASSQPSIAHAMMISSASHPRSMSYGVEMASTEKALGGIMGVKDFDWILRYDTGLEFHTFYHPFSGEYIKNLNYGGLSRGNKPPEFPPGLMESDTTIPSDNGRTFEDAYDPNFNYGFVQKPADFATRTYYKENVCFDPCGANSLYNWELFFHAPLYIATRLSKNGKYEEAMKWFHYIFDPTTDEMPAAGESETSRYWKVLPFKTEAKKTLEELFRDLNKETDLSSPYYNPKSEWFAKVSAWRDNPFDPHLVASNRPLAYMKHVVIKYVENLIAWGDSKFRQFQRESVNEALQIYVIANHILGPRPEFVPKRGEIKAETYDNLKDELDAFSNALVELENIFPYSSGANASSSSTGTSLLGIGSALYFCIQANEKLIDYWDTVADRLYKIRHCQDIDGVERKLALFSPPIEPGALIQAASQGLSLGSILADLSSPPPIYRFAHLMQKANEFCADVKALGSALLTALEKKDAEELGRLRASHETHMFELMTDVRERQVLDAKAHKENLEKARTTASFRLQHYIDLLGNDSVTVPSSPTISTTLTADSQLPADTAIVTVETDVDESLVNSDESGVKLIPKEKEDLEKALDSMTSQQFATGAEGIAGLLHLIPDFALYGTPLGVGGKTRFGGSQLGSAASGLAKVPQIISQVHSHQAAQAAKMAGFIRREQDWTLQANLAAREIIQLDKQITLADIRIQVAKTELENHKKQIENTKEIELFLKDKFTNQELYQWMKEQLFAVYKQSYNLAFDMAKKAEKAYKFELGTKLASFIQYGYWDSSKQGLAAGEKLQLALRQMEKSYLEENRRELELSKSISLARLNPLALIELRETGKCYVIVPEELFDLDFRGHYFRRIKSVRLSIPCVAGPYTSVSCTLRLLNNTVRINTSLGTQYEHNNEEGIWTDDDRFRTNYTPVTSIATSTAQNDSGIFEFNFRDERYLPFELAGAISEWQVELSMDKELRQFDYSTISDVILHLNYTARESGGLFKQKATTYIKTFLMNTAKLTEQPLMEMFSMKHEFPTEWHKFLHPATDGGEQILKFTLGKERFPFFVQDRDVEVMKLEVLAKCTQATSYYMVLSYGNLDGGSVTISKEMPQDNTYDGLNTATINDEVLDIAKEMTLKLRSSLDVNKKYTDLVTEPEEVEDMFFVVHYKLKKYKN